MTRELHSQNCKKGLSEWHLTLRTSGFWHILWHSLWLPARHVCHDLLFFTHNLTFLTNWRPGVVGWDTWLQTCGGNSLYFSCYLTVIFSILYFSKKWGDYCVINYVIGSWGSVVVKALRYKSEGPGIDSPCRRGFSPWHLTVPRALGSTQPLKVSTRISLGLKVAGA